MGSYLIADLVRGLDGRPLCRFTTGWPGFFEGAVDIDGVRRIGDGVLFTLSLPTPPNDVNLYIDSEELERQSTDKVRLFQGDDELPTTVVGILRTGTAESWLPGPDAYHFRVRVSVTTSESPERLVLRLSDNSESSNVLAEVSSGTSAQDDISGILASSVIARPLLEQMQHATDDEEFDVVIDVNLNAAAEREKVLDDVQRLLAEVAAAVPSQDALAKERRPPRGTEHYVFQRLTKAAIVELVRRDAQGSGATVAASGSARSIFRIWPDFQVHALLDRSIPTIKSDAARTAFSAAGHGIRWAVVDSGIDKGHTHFKRHKNLVITDPNVTHRDFLTGRKGRAALVDEFGHGTHVAGIIAGEQPEGQKAGALIRTRDEEGKRQSTRRTVSKLRGVAPECELVSLRVLDAEGDGKVTTIMEALDYINQVNVYGRKLRIHGVNLSVGYEFDAEWFACGQSPLCVEVDRLVRSGVVVVVAAGNTGYGGIRASDRPTAKGGLDLTINDPGNAERAITVGSTHPAEPHTYGVSFFSSKGPTGDGRSKPDLVAPGERIVSCAAGNRDRMKDEKNVHSLYVDDSGTSMAAPHVSGAVAAFLSIRNEFKGQPERVKELLVENATDLGRDPQFQGAGLLDLMRMIQAV